MEDRGQAIVETALSLSILVFILLGGADFARAMAAQAGVVNGARAGAEALASRAVTTTAAAETIACAEIDSVPGVDPSLTACTVSLETTGDELVTSRVRYTFNTIVPWPFVPNTLNLDKTVVFRSFDDT